MVKAGDEPDWSGTFSTKVLHAPSIASGVMALLEWRDSLIPGIRNGFQGFSKLGLAPYSAYGQADTPLSLIPPAWSLTPYRQAAYGHV